jgi:hypothetical protein
MLLCMRSLLWLFIVSVALLDTFFFVRCRGPEWEQNPIAMSVYAWGGNAAVAGYRSGWLAFAWAMNRSRARGARYVLPVWTAAHVYLLGVLFVSACAFGL